MKGLILTNAYSANPHSANQPLRLKEEFARLGVEVDIQRNDGFWTSIDREGEVQTTLGGYDFCVYLDKDKYVSALLEKAGLRLFNSHLSILTCDDKMETAIALSGKGIPMPKTLPGLLCYTPHAKVREEILDRVERELGYPVIVKESYGSFGAQVYLASTRPELESIASSVQYKHHLFQEFVPTSYGRDIRVIVIGGEVVACMERRSSTDFRANIERGGVGYPIDLPEEAKDLAIRAANALSLDYCGVDILFGKDDYLLCEVNSNAFFGGIEKVTGVNVARAYAEYILKEMTE